MPSSTLYLMLSGLLWGTGGLIGTLFGQAAGLSALSVAAYRLLAGGGLIFAFLALTRKRRPVGRLDRADVATMAVALAGLGLLTSRPGGGLSETAVLAGTGAALLSAAGFAAVTLLEASPVAGLDELTLNGFGFLLGGLALLPVAVAFGHGMSFRPDLASAGLLAALGAGPTAAAYTLYYRGLRNASASTAALLTLIEPLTAAALAALVLGEKLSAAGITGAALLLAALTRTVRSDRRAPAVGQRAEEQRAEEESAVCLRG